MKVTGVKDSTKKIVMKTKATAESMTLQPWWLEADEQKAASMMLTTAAYLKEYQGFRYKQAAIFARLYGNQ